MGWMRIQREFDAALLIGAGLLGAVAGAGQQQLASAQECSVQGQVFNAVTGEPVGNAQVTARPLKAPSAAVKATTDAAGRFSMGLTAGDYRLSVERDGYNPTRYGGPNRESSVLRLSPGQHLNEVILRLSPQSVITGRVTDENGNPLSQARVLATRVGFLLGRRQLLPAGTASADPTGQYQIAKLSAGQYYISASYEPAPETGATPESGKSNTESSSQGYAPAIYPGTTDPAGATPIEVRAGDQVQGIDLRLSKRPLARIRGRVENATAASGAKLHVSLWARDAGYSALIAPRTAMVRDQHGRFELRNVPPGSYILQAEWSQGKARYRSAQPLEVGESNIDDITLSISSGSDLAGRIRIAGQDQVRLAGTPSLTLRPADIMPMASPSVKVNADGSFELHNIAPYKYRVMLSGLPENYYLKAVMVGGREAPDGIIDLSQGVAPGAIEIVLSPSGGQIDGTVLAPDQRPAGGAQVLLLPDAARRDREELYRTAVADQNGNFTLSGISPGDYKLFAWAGMEQGAYLDPEFLKQFESKGESVSVTESSRTRAQVKVLAAATAQ